MDVPDHAMFDASADDPAMAAAPRAKIMLCRPDGHLRPLALIEADVIRLAIARYGDYEEAARHLGIGRATLYRKVAGLVLDRRTAP